MRRETLADFHGEGPPPPTRAWLGHESKQNTVITSKREESIIAANGWEVGGGGGVKLRGAWGRRESLILGYVAVKLEMKNLSDSGDSRYSLFIESHTGWYVYVRSNRSSNKDIRLPR